MKVRKDVSLQLNDLCSNSITEEKQIIRVFYDLSFKSSNLDFLFFALFLIQRCLYILSQTDGAGDWREKEAKDLTELVQRRITYLQVMFG